MITPQRLVHILASHFPKKLAIKKHVTIRLPPQEDFGTIYDNGSGGIGGGQEENNAYNSIVSMAKELAMSGRQLWY